MVRARVRVRVRVRVKVRVRVRVRVRSWSVVLPPLVDHVRVALEHA